MLDTNQESATETQIVIDGLRDQLQQAAAWILPDAGAMYIVLGDEISPGFRCGALGYSGRDLDIALRPFLSHWRGRGVAILIDDQVLGDYVKQL